MAIAASARVRRARNESSESESAALRPESGGGLCAKAGREAARQSARKRAGRSLTRGGRGAEALKERDRATRHPDSKVHHAAPFRPVARPPPTREADRGARLRRGLHQQTPWATPQCLAVRRARRADLHRPLHAATPDVGRTRSEEHTSELQSHSDLV